MLSYLAKDYKKKKRLLEREFAGDTVVYLFRVVLVFFHFCSAFSRGGKIIIIKKKNSCFVVL